jgi:hypothetical protein
MTVQGRDCCYKSASLRIYSLGVFAWQKLHEFITAALRGGKDDGYVS